MTNISFIFDSIFSWTSSFLWINTIAFLTVGGVHYMLAENKKTDLIWLLVLIRFINSSSLYWLLVLVFNSLYTIIKKVQSFIPLPSFIFIFLVLTLALVDKISKLFDYLQETNLNEWFWLFMLFLLFLYGFYQPFRNHYDCWEPDWDDPESVEAYIENDITNDKDDDNPFSLIKMVKELFESPTFVWFSFALVTVFCFSTHFFLNALFKIFTFLTLLVFRPFLKDLLYLLVLFLKAFPFLWRFANCVYRYYSWELHAWRSTCVIFFILSLTLFGTITSKISGFLFIFLFVISFLHPTIWFRCILTFYCIPFFFFPYKGPQILFYWMAFSRKNYLVLLNFGLAFFSKCICLLDWSEKFLILGGFLYIVETSAFLILTVDAHGDIEQYNDHPSTGVDWRYEGNIKRNYINIRGLNLPDHWTEKLCGKIFARNCACFLNSKIAIFIYKTTRIGITDFKSNYYNEPIETISSAFFQYEKNQGNLNFDLFFKYVKLKLERWYWWYGFKFLVDSKLCFGFSISELVLNLRETPKTPMIQKIASCLKTHKLDESSKLYPSNLERVNVKTPESLPGSPLIKTLLKSPGQVSNKKLGSFGDLIIKNELYYSRKLSQELNTKSNIDSFLPRMPSSGTLQIHQAIEVGAFASQSHSIAHSLFENPHNFGFYYSHKNKAFFGSDGFIYNIDKNNNLKIHPTDIYSPQALKNNRFNWDTLVKACKNKTFANLESDEFKISIADEIEYTKNHKNFEHLTGEEANWRLIHLEKNLELLRNFQDVAPSEKIMLMNLGFYDSAKLNSLTDKNPTKLLNLENKLGEKKCKLAFGSGSNQKITEHSEAAAALLPFDLNFVIDEHGEKLPIKVDGFFKDYFKVSLSTSCNVYFYSSQVYSF